MPAPKDPKKRKLWIENIRIASKKQAKKNGGNPRQIEAMRKANLGNKYCLGKKQSKEVIEKRVEGARKSGYFERLREEMRGKKLHLGYSHSSQTKEILREKGKKQWKDPKIREMKSKALQELWKDPKFRKLMTEKIGCNWGKSGSKAPNFKGGPILVECAFCHKVIYRKRMKVLKSKSKRFFCSLNCKGAWQKENQKFNDETKEKLRKASKKNWKDPKCREKTIRAIIKASHVKPNKAELKLNNILQEFLPGQYALNVKAEIMLLGGKIPDFVNVNGEKKIIELYGDYYHRNEKLNSDGDGGAQRKNIFAKFGFATLIIWEHELKEEKILVRKIRKFNKQKNQLQYCFMC